MVADSRIIRQRRQVAQIYIIAHFFYYEFGLNYKDR